MVAPLTKPSRVDSDNDDVIIIKFADSKIPKFKESKNADYIRYGEDNAYPDYLTYLYNKSAKNNAIINGKSFYIFGNGFENGDMPVNRLGESLNDISKKCIKDIEVYGGFKVECLYNHRGLIAEIYHVNYNTIRVSKDGNFYHSELWKKFTGQDEITSIRAFNIVDTTGSCIYQYNEYRPDVKYYPLPSYIGSNNYIETDIEISKYYLSAIRNGMTPSKMFQFFDGEPSEDKKRNIEARFKQKFAGSENAGNLILVFGKDPNKAVKVDDLSGTELDKQFIEMNKTCSQEIFSGHSITSGALFGIKTEGQLGQTQELQISYGIFQNTYAKPKAEAFSKEIEYLLSFSIWKDEYALSPTDPIGIQLNIDSVIDLLPKSFILRTIGVPEADWEEENVQTKTAKQAPYLVNDNIKNLSGRQHQALDRIIRKYKKGQMTEEMARTMLKTGLGLSDDDINAILGIKTQMSADSTDDEIIGLFDACGENRDDYEIVKSKKVYFSSSKECEEDERVYFDTYASGYDVTTTEAKILELIKKDNKITPEIIARTIGQTKAFVESKIKNLTQRGFLEATEVASGLDTVLEYKIAEDILMPIVTINKVPATSIKVLYSYEGPYDDRNRAFCRRMLDLKRLYSRADIERISERLGYSVFDRRGGFWTRKGTNITTPWCRHIWKSNIVVTKK